MGQIVINKKLYLQILDLFKLLKAMEEISKNNYKETDIDKQYSSMVSFKKLNMNFSTILHNSDVEKYAEELFWLFDGARNSLASALTIGFDVDSRTKLFLEGKDKMEKISQILKTIKIS